MMSTGTKCCIAWTSISILAGLILMISLLATSLKKLDTNEVGLRYDTNARKLDKEAKQEGLYAWRPGFRFIVFPGTTDTISFTELKCLNVDGITIRLWVDYQYRPRHTSLYKLVMQFRDYDGYKKVLEYVGSSAIRDVCSLFNATHFQTDRSSIQATVQDRLIERYDELDTDIIEVQVKNIDRPDSYEVTNNQKEGAREEIKVAEQEEPLKITEAQTKLLNSEAAAKIRINKANSEAKVIMSRAEAEAETILHTYEKEAETYRVIVSQSGFGFDTDGFLAYLGVRVIEDAHKDVFINMEEPAA